jgi:hypothetical protein
MKLFRPAAHVDTAKLRALAALVDLRDVLALGGTGATAYGLALVYAPAAWIFCGLMALGIALAPALVALRRDNE